MENLVLVHLGKLLLHQDLADIPLDAPFVDTEVYGVDDKLIQLCALGSKLFLNGDNLLPGVEERGGRSAQGSQKARPPQNY